MDACGGLSLFELHPSVSVTDEGYDCIIIVTDSDVKLTGNLSCCKDALAKYAELDNAWRSEVVLFSCEKCPKRTIVFSPTGPLNRDQDDVRRFYDAAVNGVNRALKAGLRKPLLVRPIDDSFPLASKVAVFGALHAAYVPLEIREGCPDRKTKLDKMGVWCTDMARVSCNLPKLHAVEYGRIVARDIGGSDPERMAAPRVLEYVQQTLKDTCIKINVVSDRSVLEKEYPLLSAVDRAARFVPRHTARVIHLEYVGEGDIDTTLMLVGKGITYDTGGADIKAGGIMAGMHRDKCGAAAVAGFFKFLSIYKPKGLKVLGTMCMVRNSVGSECYVADEIITSRAGVRVRVGNTDAEGRMAMTDPLCQMKERASGEKNPRLFTWATLTGHVIRAFGEEYTGVMDNGPARALKTAQTLQEAGDLLGDPIEISTIRRDDFMAHTGPSEYEDVLQANNKASTLTDRGHQNPSAFMIMASGLDKHGKDSDKPLPYTHVDVAGSSGPFPGVPTGAPILAFAQAFVLHRESSV